VVLLHGREQKMKKKLLSWLIAVDVIICITALALGYDALVPPSFTIAVVLTLGIGDNLTSSLHLQRYTEDVMMHHLTTKTHESHEN
jgi:hypothetical protein